MTNIWTEALFNTNPIEFVTGVVDGNYRPGRDGAAVITIPEMLGAGAPNPLGTGTNAANNYLEQIQRNLSGSGYQSATGMQALSGLIMPAVKTVGVGIGFKAAKKLTRAPRAKLNRALRDFGMGSVVRI